MTEAPRGSLRRAGEIEMYVEIDGEGSDLVLLHGGGGTVDDLAALRSRLRPGHRLIVPEQRAHGRTPVRGDHALVRDGNPVGLEHTLAMYHALPDAQLAVIPGADHHVPQTRPEGIAALVLSFLGGGATGQPAG